MFALRATDAGEPPVQDAALPEGLEAVPDAGAQRPVCGREAVVVHPEKLLEVLLDDLPERRFLRLAGVIDVLGWPGDGAGKGPRNRFGYRRCHCRTLLPR